MVPGSLNKVLDELDDTEQADNIDALYETFADWAEESGRPLYPHQEDALLELLDGNHVIAQTPTGSGKSLIALAAHFISLARGGRSYYTAPLKALVSEKFFDLVDAFGAANVGMVTGDVALNPKAPIICCTAEILANQSLREGADLDTDMVIMDEFHFYGDPQRGWAWQVPLLELPSPQFVFLSATLGDTAEIAAELKERTGRDTSLISDAVRPVPLEFEYLVDDLDPIVQRLIKEDRAPVYIVHFTQNDAVKTAVTLGKTLDVPKETRAEIQDTLRGVELSRGFGKTLRELLLKGVAVHHAGMLPRYRRLVVAPEGFRSRITQLIAREAAADDGHIVIKANAIVDPDIIDALYDASHRGTRIELFVRGVCALRPGVPGRSENITVRSILGRYLEHSRIFAFHNDGDPQVYMGSADMMHRNLDRRVEALVRVVAPAQVKELVDFFDLALSDGTSSWRLDASGDWVRHAVDADGKPLVDLQERTMTNVQRRRRGRAVR